MVNSPTLTALENELERIVTTLRFHKVAQHTNRVLKYQDQVRVARRMLRLYVLYTPISEQYTKEHDG